MTRNSSLFAVAAPLTLLCAAPAMAQDHPLWGGWYIGGNIGGVWGEGSATLRTTPGPGGGGPTINPLDVTAINGGTISGSKSNSGFTGGIEGGYNWVSNDWLIGIESDWGFMDIDNGSSRTVQSPVLINPQITYTLTQDVKTDWIWTLRPRLGFISGSWLFYGTVGLAVSEVKSSLHFHDNALTPHVVSHDDNGTQTGWIGGLGVGYAFSPEWSFKGEWLYTDFGTVSSSGTGPDGFVTLKSDASVRGNLFRVGVDYQF
jgi:outer membrane immunogenic protein